MRPANTSACLFNLSLFHLHSRTHFENLSLYATACLAAWLPGCLPVRPTKGPTTRAPLPRRHRAAATWPVLLLLRPLPPAAPHLLCAALPPACSLLLVQTLFCTRLPHVPITLLGSGFFKRRQTTDAAARTRASPFPSPYFDFSFGKKKPARSCRSQKNYHFCPFAFNRLISQPAAGGRGQYRRRRTVNSPPRRHAPTMCS